ncbi:CGNR zinc finger domain-containing protein [Agromyces atrinae]|uniref:Putative RNA-binding Zn ribbon-like protein n=1 Tax=Agromyces atrinae TaxID=592376 RepID=A0A852SKF8_9MICO|nr:CGNR zinc finger domain-containing protein [Agromyces atrinae]NYD66917.1 putative RNA-binding Zn ribbon-like protein [Agromyces atrinae]
MPISTVSIPIGQWLSTDGRAWWFDSGSLALDFAYTGAMPDDAARETFHSPAELTTWLSERLPLPVSPARSRDLLDAKALRDAVARLAVEASGGGDARTGDIDTINLFAATPDIPPALAGATRQAGRSLASVPQALSTIARDAVGVFAPGNRQRIRVCAGEDCSIVYLDTSRAGSRRWCSMQRCGNRSKVRAHRARLAAR